MHNLARIFRFLGLVPAAVIAAAPAGARQATGVPGSAMAWPARYQMTTPSAPGVKRGQ
jgi:hypothetical protein